MIIIYLDKITYIFMAMVSVVMIPLPVAVTNVGQRKASDNEIYDQNKEFYLCSLTILILRFIFMFNQEMELYFFSV